MEALSVVVRMVVVGEGESGETGHQVDGTEGGALSASQRRAAQLRRGGKLYHVATRRWDAGKLQGKCSAMSMEDLFESDGGR